jgi:hypothetical protein
MTESKYWSLKARGKGLSGNAVCRKCGQEDKSSYHVLRQYPSLAQHRVKIFCPAWSEMKGINRASIRQVLVVPLRTGLFSRVVMKTGAHNGPSVCLSASSDLKLSPPPCQCLLLLNNILIITNNRA